jgi:hypothetical protein
MENLLTSLLPSKDEGRILVITKDRNGDLDWIDAAEFAQSTGITPEQYPAWLNSMREMGAVAVSDKKAH